jgi:hypothetical protein
MAVSGKAKRSIARIPGLETGHAHEHPAIDFGQDDMHGQIGGR